MVDYVFQRTSVCPNCQVKDEEKNMVKFNLRIDNKKEQRFLCSHCFQAHVFPILLTDKEKQQMQQDLDRAKKLISESANDSLAEEDIN